MDYEGRPKMKARRGHDPNCPSCRKGIVHVACPIPNPTPKPTAEQRVVELTQALKVIDEMRRQNLARVDDATRKAFKQAAEMAQRKADGIACANPRNRAVARALLDFADELHALAKEQGK